MLDKSSGLTLADLKRFVHYAPDSGQFTWLVKLSNRVTIGDVAGSLDAYGYIQIKINKFPYKAHRLAWFYMTGEWPKEQLDHINRNRSDNKFENLREATYLQNTHNQSASKNIASGLKGAYKNKNVWMSFINVNGIRKYLGQFKTPEEAHEAYVSAAKFYFSEFATDGKPN